MQVENSLPMRVIMHSSAQQGQIRLIVVDDQRLFRESIANLLIAESGFEVLGTAGNGLEALELCRQRLPDFVLMDVKMPHMDGIEATRQIKQEFPSVRVLLLTTFTSDGYVMEGLAAGADGYILKDTSAVGLISAIRSVHAGEQVTAPGVATRLMQLVERQESAGNASNDGLTAREMETLILVAKGMIAKEIARSLEISEKTVRNHISSIYRKLNIYDRSQIVIYAMKKGLIDLQDM